MLVLWPLRFAAELDGEVSLRRYDLPDVDELFAALDDVLVWEHIRTRFRRARSPLINESSQGLPTATG